MTKTLENSYYYSLAETREAKRKYQENPTRENEIAFEKQKENFGNICIKVIVELLKEDNEQKLKKKNSKTKQ